MVQAMQARKAALQDLQIHFGLQPTTAYEFFPEWMDVSLALTSQDQQQLDRVKTRFIIQCRLARPLEFFLYLAR